jgi:hypothetical protein
LPDTSASSYDASTFTISRKSGSKISTPSSNSARAPLPKTVRQLQNSCRWQEPKTTNDKPRNEKRRASAGRRGAIEIYRLPRRAMRTAMQPSMSNPSDINSDEEGAAPVWVQKTRRRRRVGKEGSSKNPSGSIRCRDGKVPKSRGLIGEPGLLKLTVGIFHRFSSRKLSDGMRVKGKNYPKAWTPWKRTYDPNEVVRKARPSRRLRGRTERSK